MKTTFILTAALAACIMTASCGPTVKSTEEASPASDGYLASSKATSAYSIEKQKKTDRHYNNVYEMLDSMSGVSVDGTVIRIRGGSGSINGSNDPLIIVDGAEASIEGLSPEDVHHIEVIKDGSSAIYGLRGANGVILITTKGAYMAKEAEKAAKKAEKAAKKAEKEAKKKAK